MEHKMAGTTVVFLAHQGHEHISSSQAEWSQITKKTWMLSTHLFFLQAIHHPLYLKHHTPKKRDQSLVTKFHNFHHLDQMFFKSYFPLPPPHGSNPPNSAVCVFPVFFPQLGSLRAPLWPSGSDQKLQDPYLPARPEVQARPSRGKPGEAGDK